MKLEVDFGAIWLGDNYAQIVKDAIAFEVFFYEYLGYFYFCIALPFMVFVFKTFPTKKDIFVGFGFHFFRKPLAIHFDFFNKRFYKVKLRRKWLSNI